MPSEIPLDAQGMIMGPGSDIQDEVQPEPMLDKTSEYEYVEILNPLSADFPAKVGATKPVNAPLRVYNNPATPTSIKSESDLANRGLAGFKNNDHPSSMHLAQQVILKSGQTTRLRGPEAKVVVRQLVNEIMMREGNKERLADLHARNIVEKRIIQRIGNMEEFMQTPVQTVTEQLNNALESSNEEFSDANPDANRPKEPIVGQSDSRGPGRPKKSVADKV